MISLDTETTGVDLYHGVQPFLVTVCDEEYNNTWWEWDVDPLIRKPIVNQRDLREIKRHIRGKEIVFQNPKFDVKALNTVSKFNWDWGKVYDTLLAGHLLASGQPHDLSTMCLVYLGVNVQPQEDNIEKAVKDALKIVKKKYPDWMIAHKDLSCMPSAKGKLWKFDMWVPRAVAKAEGYSKKHPWWGLCAEYANMDSATTLALFQVQKELMQQEDLWEIYLERLKILPIVYGMENYGVTYQRSRLKELAKDYTKVVERCKKVCVNLSGGKLEELPKGVTNNLKDVVFNHFGLESNKKSKKTGQPSMDKEVLAHWLETVPIKSKAYRFIKTLKSYRQRAVALSYMESYEKFSAGLGDWRTLHPSLNPTGTKTLRFASSNPNEQNISKKEGFNLRYCFGPTPGRMWASLDYNNIELRIPAYECREPAMLELFEHPDEAPYFGSYHLLVFDILHPEKFAKYGVKVKDVYKATWYQWTKNGNFAEMYGAVESSGTADRAFHVKGAQREVASRLTKKSELNQYWIDYANDNGYVETMPDRTVGSSRGYPLQCAVSKWGSIKPTIPLNYHIQGTACWVMARAMVGVQEYLDKINRKLPTSKHWFIGMQVHDELVIDFPICSLPVYRHHLNKIRGIMESIGRDINVPLTCGCELHKDNWSTGVELV